MRSAGAVLASVVVVAALGSLFATAGPIASATAAPSAFSPQEAPLELPPRRGNVRNASVDGDWIIGARPGAEGRRVARAAGAAPVVARAGIFVVPAADAREFAERLNRRGLLIFAEPNVTAVRQAFPSDPLSGGQWWIGAIVPTSLTPPPVSASSPLLGVVEASADPTHPELAGVAGLRSIDPEEDEHGTAVIAAAAAPDNDLGIVGAWPGMRVQLFPEDGSCASVVQAVDAATRAGAAVINMSYGFIEPGACYAHYVATQIAFGAGSLPVAAGGNEFEEGNPEVRPAVDPHVVSVAALNPNLTSSYFSNENPGIDVAGPGQSVLTAVPAAVDTDSENPPGYARLDGTSFAAPIVAALAAWLKQARPDLSAGQLALALQLSARDLGEPGWDPRFGYGAVDIAAALTLPEPPVDLAEPNDDIEWIDGRRFAEADPFLWRGRGRRTVAGTVDLYEDPVDVFRVKLPRRSVSEFKLVPIFGDSDLEVWGPSAKTVYANYKRRVAISKRAGKRVERLRIRNRARRALAVYVDAFVPSGVSSFNAWYQLRMRRVK